MEKSLKRLDLLRISQTVDSTQVLGPGNRAVIWVHGCCFHCPGCLADTYHDGEFYTAAPDQMAQWYLQIPGAQGLTVSGGEPMLQAAALAETIRLIRQRNDVGVIVYTGFTYETLCEKARTDAGIRNFLDVIDLLIDGPYLEDHNDGTPYRGSSNQRLIMLTERYAAQLESYYHQAEGRRIEINLTPAGTVLVGVPDAGQLAIWKNIKKLGEKSNDTTLIP